MLLCFLGQVEVHLKGLYFIICALSVSPGLTFSQKILNCCPGGGKAKFTSVPKVADG